MKDYAKQDWLREPRKHRVRDAVFSTLKYAAIYAATTIFMIVFVWMATAEQVWL